MTAKNDEAKASETSGARTGSEPTEPREGETLAFDEKFREWRALAFHREGPDARIVIMRGEDLIGENESYPAYRIYNVAAHLPDMVEAHERAEEEP